MPRGLPPSAEIILVIGAGALLLPLLPLDRSHPQRPPSVEVSAADLQRVQPRAGVRMVDIRPAFEFARIHAPRAESFPVESLANIAAKGRQLQTMAAGSIIIICADDGQSAIARQLGERYPAAGNLVLYVHDESGLAKNNRSSN